MGLTKQTIENDIWTITLDGRIDTTNASDVENALQDSPEIKKVIIDMKALEYISSAGLRILLRLRKQHPDIEIIHVSTDVYEILEMTGFTEMMKVRKAYRQISVEGCPVIGRGSNGIVYRTDPETVVKVYFNKDALPEIHHERDVARKALILGIPTALSYDVVQVDDGYGSVFELLNANSISSYIAKNPQNLDEPASYYIDMLKTIHGIETKHGEFPSVKETALNWAEFLKDYLPLETYDKLIQLITDIPEDDHLVHGDYHPNNVMRQNGETLLIDMDTLSQGHPIFEFATMFLAFKGFHIINPETCLDFFGYPIDTAYRFWKKSLAMYLDTEDDAILQDLEDRCSVIGYTRLMRRTIRRIGFDDPEGKKLIDICKKNLIELCDRYNKLI